MHEERASPGKPIPAIIEPFEINDGMPDEEEIAAGVKKLRSNRAGGPTGMRAEHLKEWLSKAKAEENPDPTDWQKVVKLTQTAFGQGELPTELFWSTAVLLPKGGGDFRGIGLTEVIWKAIAIIIDDGLSSSIKHHDSRARNRCRHHRGKAHSADSWS